MDYPYSKDDRRALRYGRGEIPNPWGDVFRRSRAGELAGRLRRRWSEDLGRPPADFPAWIQGQLDAPATEPSPAPVLEELEIIQLEKLLATLEQERA